MRDAIAPYPGPHRLPSSVYWRRRAVALALAIALICLLAWAVGGTLGGSPSQAGAGGGSPGRLARAGGSGRAGPGHGRGASGLAGAGTVSAKPLGAAAGRSPSPSPSPPRSPSPSPSQGSRRAVAPLCAPGGLVLSLFPAQTSYRAGQWPVFTVDVVSTATRDCWFDVGMRSVSVLLTSGGARVWESADCVRGAGVRMVRLPRGVPLTLHLTWDRETSGPGCQLARRPAGPGTYSAIAVSGHLRSRPVLLVISNEGGVTASSAS